MARLRQPTRKVVTSSDGEDGDYQETAQGNNLSDDEEPVRPQRKGAAKAKPVKKGPSPRKSIVSPRKPKSVSSSPAKSKKNSISQLSSNAKPIYSFFNAVTQKQTGKSPSASPEKPSIILDDPDVIQDDSDDGHGSVQFSKGSSTAMAVRKRKVQHSESFESDGLQAPAGSQKFYKTNKGDRVSSLSVINDDKRPWTDQFAPRDLSELAVHKRKADDVRQWFESTINGRRQKVLVLKGAAGTGKTTTIKLVARELGLEVLEWKAPSGTDVSGEGNASYSVHFSEFIGRAGRSTGLQFDTGNGGELEPTPDIVTTTSPERSQLLLIEEFPGTFSRTSSTLSAFRSALLQHLAAPALHDSRPTPIVLIISETLLSTNTALADSFTAHRLLGAELANHPYLNMIEFNAVAPTILLKALQAIVLKEARVSGRRKTPGTQVLKRLAEAGDIRSAVSSLEFLCVRGDDGDTWSSKVAFTKPKKARVDQPLTQAEEDALRLVSNRESTLGIFHSVGKVVYNKRIAPPSSQTVPQPPDWLPQHRRTKVPDNDIDRLIDELGTDTSTFFAALHENYALSCQGREASDTLDSLVGSIESISDADLLSVDRFAFGTRSFSGSATDSLRQDEMAFQVAVRGLWFSLPSPVTRIVVSENRRADAHRMFYPTSLKLWRKREEIETLLELLASRLKGHGLVGSAKTQQGTGKTGVESWKRNNNDASETVQSSGGMNSAKMELLTERLPYMAMLLGAARHGTSTPLLEHITKVTRVRDPLVQVGDDNDDAEPNDDDETGGEKEQWTTDRPETEGETTGRKKMKVQAKRVDPWAKQSLPAAVESAVEKLVLEDDDIIDD